MALVYSSFIAIFVVVGLTPFREICAIPDNYFCQHVEMVHRNCQLGGGVLQNPTDRAGKAGPRGQKGEKGDVVEIDYSLIAEMLDSRVEALRTHVEEEIAQCNWKLQQHKLKIEELNQTFESIFLARSCQDVNSKFAISKNATGGMFKISPVHMKPMEVYCDTETDGGGWTVFQRRMDGSVNFVKNWDSYLNGFGDPQGEFWLGLDKIQKMISDGEYELRVDMIERNGVHHYAKYATFHLTPASDYFRLNVTGFSGNATDSMEYHNNLQFSTYDRDHDNSRNCASFWKGAWWYNACYYSHLNGQYTGSDGKAMQWWHKINPTGWDPPSRAIFLKFSEMKFRKVKPPVAGSAV